MYIVGGAKRGSRPILGSNWFIGLVLISLGAPFLVAMLFLYADSLSVLGPSPIRIRRLVFNAMPTLVAIALLLPTVAALSVRAVVTRGSLLLDSALSDQPVLWLAQAIHLRILVAAIPAVVLLPVFHYMLVMASTEFGSIPEVRLVLNESIVASYASVLRERTPGFLSAIGWSVTLNAVTQVVLLAMHGLTLTSLRLRSVAIRWILGSVVWLYSITLSAAQFVMHLDMLPTPVLNVAVVLSYPILLMELFIHAALSPLKKLQPKEMARAEGLIG